MGKDKAPAGGKGKPADAKPAEGAPAKDAGKAAPAGGKSKGKK